ncbi:uncharacterized protein OCT59_000237 [Rhizophagus irregularis]|uniref:uncharacterized protein n=1 Tax=Rhizophagus irregularis TaxID=588596 RepID=UPI00332C0F53|nr:hypothetical protein OCT59_000237 [Rhizophagus irregularis]
MAFRAFDMLNSVNSQSLSTYYFDDQVPYLGNSLDKRLKWFFGYWDFWQYKIHFFFFIALFNELLLTVFLGGSPDLLNVDSVVLSVSFNAKFRHSFGSLDVGFDFGEYIIYLNFLFPS